MPINSSSSFHLFSAYGFARLGFAIITGVQKSGVRKLNISSQCNESFLSGVSLNGKQIKVLQHYFEEPVLQPRPPKGGRREADLTGLKGRLNRINGTISRFGRLYYVYING